MTKLASGIRREFNMGGSSGAIASGLSLASTGLQAYGAYEQGKGTDIAEQYKADELNRAAEYGDLKATQAGAQMTRNLNITLGNIDAVRAAAHDNSTSPTGAAVRDYTENVGTEQKTITVDSIEAQLKQQEADAQYMRYAGNQALLAGDISAASSIIGGASGALGGKGGGAPGISGTPNPAAPYTTGAPY